MRTVIVDDELMAQKALQRHCEKSKQVELLQVCENGQSALNYLNANEVDLIFLDIEMPDISGLELLDQLTVIPQVILTTSNIEYAADAFEYDVTDFLTKPILFPRFQKSVTKASTQFQILQKRIEHSAKNEIYIRTDGRLVRLPFSEISYFENIGDYIKVHSARGAYIIHGALKSLVKKLDHPRMVKVHRSYIVNLDHIVDIEDNTIVIHDKVVPISRAHKPELLKGLNIL